MPAGDEPVNFNRRSADLIGRTIQDFRGRGRGEVPLPKRRRNPGDGGSGGSATLEAIFMVVTDDILAATGDITSIDVGFGSAQLYSIDPSTKTRTPIGDPVEVFNYDTELHYPARTEIWCIYHPIEEVDPPFYEVILGACSQLDSGP